jgi:protein gp37
MNPQWARDVISDCQRVGIAPFHKQWGSYRNNPLVAESGWTLRAAEIEDRHGKGGGLLDGRLWREFPRGLERASVAA